MMNWVFYFLTFTVIAHTHITQIEKNLKLCERYLERLVAVTISKMVSKYNVANKNSGEKNTLKTKCAAISVKTLNLQMLAKLERV